MCEQLKILEKIHKEGKMNGFSIDLAEAQAKDFIMVNKKVGNIEKDVASIKKEQKRIKNSSKNNEKIKEYSLEM